MKKKNLWAFMKKKNMQGFYEIRQMKYYKMLLKALKVRSELIKR